MDRTPVRDAPAIVGRRLELSAIDAFVDGVASGVRTLVLAGEPGIGKTTLWRHGVDGCVRAGVRVLRARPASDETTLSSGGLADLFGDGILEADGDDTFAGARAALAALRTMAERGPVVIAIDDLQWLDLRSYRALRYALRRFDVEPVGVLATTREGDDVPGAATFADVVPPGRASHLRVVPLSISEIREVLASTTATVPPPVLQRIYVVSGGNPLYALELARVLAVRRDAGGPPEDTVRLPGSLQAAIERRLEDAPAEVVPVLEVVSALGTPRLADVRAVLPAEDVDELVRRAQRQDLLVVEDDLRVRFSHPLLASGVYARIDPIERHALHVRLADVAHDPEAKAHHLAASTSEPDAEVAALVESAAEQAGARGAWDRAAALARASVRLTSPDDGEAARRRALAEIEYVAAAGEAGRALRLADELVASTPPGPALARVLLVRADLEDDDMATAVSLLERAVREAAEDEGLRARVLLHLADTGVLYRTPLSEAAARVREAVAIAERIGDDDLRRVASEDLAYYGVMAGAPPPVREAPAPEPGRSPTELHTPHTFEARWMLWSGDLAAARERFATDLSRPGGELQRPFRLGELALLELAAGNLADAARLAAEGVRGARDAESTYAERRIASVVALVDAWLGRIDDARRLAASIVDEEVAKGDRAGIARARLALGVALAADGSFGPAADELSAAAETLATMGIGHPGPFRVLPDAVETLCLAGRVEDAGALADRFEEQAARCASRWAAAAARGARGHVRLASGDARAAAADLAAALDDLDAMGYALEAARAALGLGRALLKEGRRTAASDTLDDARGRFAAIGAPVWERRAADALERAAPGRAAGELTVTERLVAAHVADGRRNKEIAQALFVSVATVEAHLTRIYRKLGVRGRSELAGLVTSGSVDVVTPRSDS